MPPTRSQRYALLYNNTLRARRPESAPLDRPAASGGSGLSPARARNKGHKATRLWRVGSPLETRAPDRRDRNCDRQTPRRPLWDPGRQHGSDGIRLLLPGRTDAAAVLCEPPFERLELPSLTVGMAIFGVVGLVLTIAPLAMNGPLFAAAVPTFAPMYMPPVPPSGAVTSRTCPKCERTNRWADRFCSACGAPLS